MAQKRGLKELLESARARGHDMYEDPAKAARIIRFTCANCGDLILISAFACSGSATRQECNSPPIVVN